MILGYSMSTIPQLIQLIVYHIDSNKNNVLSRDKGTRFSVLHTKKAGIKPAFPIIILFFFLGISNPIR